MSEPGDSTVRELVRGLTQRGRAPVSATATIAGLRRLSPGYTRVTLRAADLAEYAPTLPADAVKIQLPGPNGPELRAMTVAHRPAADTIEIDVLRHAGGIVSPWLAAARIGDQAEVHAVRREFAIGSGITRHLLVADASALPAAAAILRAIPAEHRVLAFLHAPSEADALAMLPAHPGLTRTLRLGAAWSPAELREALTSALDAEPGAVPRQSWIGAEAACVAEARRVLAERGESRDHRIAAAYWRLGIDSAHRDERLRAAFTDALAGSADLADPEARADAEARADRAC